jgi:hypothetical protein
MAVDGYYNMKSVVDEIIIYFFVDLPPLGFPFMASLTSGAALLIWGSYAIRSKRVKNTFIKYHIKGQSVQVLSFLQLKVQ